MTAPDDGSPGAGRTRPATPGSASGDEPAGVVTRAVAAVVDGVLVAVAGLVVQVGAGGARLLVAGPPYRVPDPPGWLTGAVAWGLAVTYLAGAWAAVGHTAGHRLMGLRVTGRDGHRLGVPRSLLRATLCLAFPLGLCWIPFSRRRASTQDLLVASAVRYDRR
ncbi:RDD family protein [Streptomyces sp. CRN 30]|uniref:RDD family protein n=1 Tax=Streptomyces sp. CRN 30 TaxID=3075613 RepID=UPI002A8220BC|nr:RDD family protein [Streptomyces sp. CRN 30]